MRNLLLALIPSLLLACNDDAKTDDTATPDDSGDTQETGDSGDSGDSGAPEDADGDGYFGADDCDDGDAAVSPAATETCNGVDDDCDGQTDEDLLRTWYTDADGDGWGDDESAVQLCDDPGGATDRGGDCDDADPAYNPGASETDCADPNDYNCDGSTGYEDADGDGYAACQDCDDEDGARNPGAAEVCNDADDDCDGETDEEGATGGSTWYADRDGDGYGDPDDTTTACAPPEGYGADASDCDDADDTENPDAAETCDGDDDDCDGEIDESGAEGESTWYTDADADGYGDPESTVLACDLPDGASAYGTDCDDTDPAYNPGATEDDCADPNDYNCDGATGFVDGDGDGWAACEECDDADAEIHPDAGELCNEADDDCDGEIDEDASDALVWYADADADGYGDPAVETTSCAAPEDAVADATDCDDTSADVSPDAYERCNAIDDDCDGAIDDEAVDASTWYTDADGDGWGDDETEALACSLEGGVETGGDCDDEDDAVNPDAAETCDGVDENCNGYVDEGATDVSTYWTDADADGYGDPESSVESCDLPDGYAADDTDCDDAEATVNPGAEELCNDVDDDCDGTADDDAADASTWYKDADKDGYGNKRSYKIQCDRPGLAWVEGENTDCLDTDASVHPGADETCDDVDEDCDGTVDEDAIDPTTWYIDADGDSYGSADTSAESCDLPDGYADDALDCDDTDPDINPDTVEIRDGTDNDCDGAADDDLHLGSGADGDLTVTGAWDLSEDLRDGRDEPDLISWTVTGIVGDLVTVDSSARGLAAGDEVLILNLHGSDDAHTHVGAYEFANVLSVSGRVLTLAQDLTVTFGETSNDDLDGQVIVLQRVPNYSSLTVESGGSLTTAGWDGATGGVLAFRVSGALTVESGGTITVDALGYAGGATGSAYNCDSYQGESYAGEGDGEGDGACSAYNESYGWWAANYGGGGAHITGGGGNYGGGAEDGDSWTGGSATAPYGGEEYGSATLDTLFFGSGGGGVWYGSSSCTGDGPGPGGDGAGVLYASAGSVVAADSGAFSAVGGSSEHCATGSWTYGAGGGAGGSVWLIADSVDLAADAVSAEGGTGNDSNTRVGGDGGDGRVRIDCSTCNGYTAGSTRASRALQTASEPDPGYSGTP